MHRTGALLHGDPERIAHQRRNRGGRDNLPGHLRQRPHRADDVDHLESRLPWIFDGLLAGEHEHGHRTEMRIGRARREVEGARAQRRQTHPGPSGEPAVRSRHESGRLLVPRDDELDARFAQRLDDVEILFPGNAEDALDALVLERGDEQVGALAHRKAPLAADMQTASLRRPTDSLMRHDGVYPPGASRESVRRERFRGGRSDAHALNAPSAVHDESYDRADEENDEQNLRDPGGTGRDSAEPEYGRDQRDDQEHDGIVQHC